MTVMLCTKEAMECLGRLTGQDFPIPRRTLSHWLNKGLPHRKIGRSLVFELGELKAWVNSHKKGASYGI